MTNPARLYKLPAKVQYLEGGFRLTYSDTPGRCRVILAASKRVTGDKLAALLALQKASKIDQWRPARTMEPVESHDRFVFLSGDRELVEMIRAVKNAAAGDYDLAMVLCGQVARRMAAAIAELKARDEVAAAA